MTTSAVTGSGRPATPPTSRGPMGSGQLPAWVRGSVAADGAGSGVLGVLLLAAPAWLVDGIGLATHLPIRVLGGLFLVNAVLNGLAAATPTWRRLAVTAAVDLSFAGVLLGVLLTAPWDSQGWAIWLTAGFGLLSLDVGALKLWSVHRVSR